MYGKGPYKTQTTGPLVGLEMLSAGRETVELGRFGLEDSAAILGIIGKWGRDSRFQAFIPRQSEMQDNERPIEDLLVFNGWKTVFNGWKTVFNRWKTASTIS